MYYADPAPPLKAAVGELLQIVYIDHDVSEVCVMLGYGATVGYCCGGGGGGTRLCLPLVEIFSTIPQAQILICCCGL